jgi:hypothetical protein
MSVATYTSGFESSLAGRVRRLAGAVWSSQATSFFWVLWTFIGLASMYDAYLVHHFIDSIPQLERNPVCRFLIMLDTEHLSVFLPAKAVGTLIVLSILRLIFLRCREFSLPITGGVAAYQAGLMVYLVV